MLVATLLLMAYGFRVLNRLHRQTDQLQLAAGVFTHAREGIIITDASASIVDVNEAFSRITGYSREEVLGQNPRILGSGRHDKAFYEALWSDLDTHGQWHGEVWNRRKSGEVYAEVQTISAVRDRHGSVAHYIALFSDITAQKEHAARLEHIAHFDALTGLPNRLLLADRMQQAMAQNGSCNQAWADSPTAASNWLRMPLEVGSYIVFHRSAMTRPLLIWGRKNNVRKKAFPFGISVSSSARTIGTKKPRPRESPTNFSVRRTYSQKFGSVATAMKLSSPRHADSPTSR
jgi:PAS domain S-box-containing protein